MAWLSHHDADSPASRTMRKVMQLESLGAEILLQSADVTDRAQMDAVVAAARARFGTIHGVLHTAGVLHDGVIQLKELATAEAVLAPKVQGTLVLEAVLKDVPLDFLILFSSISSFSGLAGQVDYAGANAFLDAYAEDRIARDGTFTVAVNWSTWREVGMAAAMGQQLGIVDDAAGSSAGVPIGHALVDQCLRNGQDERVYSTRFSIKTHWLLDEHRVRGGAALIPGTGYLEIVRAAFAHHPQSRAIEMREVTFLAPFSVKADEEKELRVRIRRDHQANRFTVESREPGTPSGQSSWTEHVRGVVAYVDLPEPNPVQPASVRARCRVRSQEFSGTEQPVHLQFGPRWSCVERIDYGPDEALLTLELPEAFRADLEQHSLHPALMDMATAGAQALIPGFDERKDFFVPASYGAIRIHAALPRRFLSHIRLRHDDAADRDLAGFDITLMDPDGRVLVEIDEFTMIRVRDKALLARSTGMVSSTDRPAAQAPARPLPTANRILALGLKSGILPAEGAAVLERILAAGAAPRVVVSPQDLTALLAELRAPATPAPALAPEGAPPGKDLAPLEAALVAHEAVREAAASASGDRVVAYVVYDPNYSVTVSELRRHVRALVPETLVPQTILELEALPRMANGALDRAALPSPFAEEAAAIGPRTEMEHVIGGLWQELLGVDRVGVHDNFFDIGGHSLLSVRFISRLDKKTGVRLQHEHVVVNTLEQLAAKCEQSARKPSAEDPAGDRKSKSLLGSMKQAVLGKK